MKTRIRNILVGFGMLSFLVSAPGMAAEIERGTVKGGVAHTAPTWFKESFLEIQDDVDEASSDDKHVILFFQLNGCPYCDRMLTESFESEPLTSYIQERFDTIAINVGGDQEVIFNEEVTMIEKDLADMLKVRATPAILFLDGENKTVVRVNGYRSPQRFQEILNYVAEKGYEQATLAEYMQSKLPTDVYTLRENPLFTETNDLSAVSGPLLVIFEDGSCYDCNEFHDRLLTHSEVQKELAPYTVVRLDAASDGEIIDVDGSASTPQALAQKYEMLYRPGVLVFDEGKLIRRNDSLLFPHHFKESLRYVSGGYYKNQDPRTYSRARNEELLSQGIDINLGME